MIRALIFVPRHASHLRTWMTLCCTYCVKRRFTPIAIVHDWADVRTLMLDGAAEKVVVASRQHADWLEVVSEEPDRNRSPRTGRTLEGRRLRHGPAGD